MKECKAELIDSENSPLELFLSLADRSYLSSCPSAYFKSTKARLTGISRDANVLDVPGRAVQVLKLLVK